MTPTPPPAQDDLAATKFCVGHCGRVVADTRKQYCSIFCRRRAAGVRRRWVAIADDGLRFHLDKSANQQYWPEEATAWPDAIFGKP